MQKLQHKQQPIEEVEAEEGRVEGQGVHPRCMYDPAQGTKAEQRVQSEPPTVTIKSPLKGARIRDTVSVVAFSSNCWTHLGEFQQN